MSVLTGLMSLTLHDRRGGDGFTTEVPFWENAGTSGDANLSRQERQGRQDRQENQFIVFLLGVLGCLGVLGATRSVKVDKRSTRVGLPEDAIDFFLIG